MISEVTDGSGKKANILSTDHVFDGNIVVPPEAEPPLDDVVTYIHEENVYIASGIFFGDASGGEHTRYLEIRWVGCAFASLDETGQPMFAARF